MVYLLLLLLHVCLFFIQSYEALPSEPAPSDVQQHNGHQAAFEDMGPSSLFPSALASSSDQHTRNVPDMGVELQQTRSKSQAGVDDITHLNKTSSIENRALL